MPVPVCMCPCAWCAYVAHKRPPWLTHGGILLGLLRFLCGEQADVACIGEAIVAVGPGLRAAYHATNRTVYGRTCLLWRHTGLVAHVPVLEVPGVAFVCVRVCAWL